MEVKNYLFSRPDDSELSRKKIFPIYTRELRLKQINKELEKGAEKLTIATYNSLMEERTRLKGMKPEHGILFRNYLAAHQSGRNDMVSQVLELVEAQYAPRVVDD